MPRSKPDRKEQLALLTQSASGQKAYRCETRFNATVLRHFCQLVGSFAIMLWTIFPSDGVSGLQTGTFTSP